MYFFIIKKLFQFGYENTNIRDRFIIFPKIDLYCLKNTFPKTKTKIVVYRENFSN